VHLKSSVEIKTELNIEIQNREKKENRKYKKREKNLRVIITGLKPSRVSFLLALASLTHGTAWVVLLRGNLVAKEISHCRWGPMPADATSSS
jgi:hypothetical protein